MYDEWFVLYRITFILFDPSNKLPCIVIHCILLTFWDYSMAVLILFMFTNKNSIPLVTETPFVIKIIEMSLLRSKPSLHKPNSVLCPSLYQRLDSWQIYQQQGKKTTFFFFTSYFSLPLTNSPLCFIHLPRKK